MNKSSRIILIILVLLALIFPVFHINSSASATINPYLFMVDVTPDNAGKVAEYHIYGVTCEYNNIDTITLSFRQDTGFISPKALSNTVTVNGEHPLSASFKYLSDGEMQSTLILSQKINKGDTIDIDFSQSAGIKNPSVPAICYTVRVVLISRGIELDNLLSNKYRITQSAVSTPTVTVDPPVKGTNAEYSISFATGVRGLLRANTDDIRIRFPQGTYIPQLFISGNIYINTTKAGAVYKDNTDPTVLRIFSGNNIQPSTPLVITIKSAFGIKNTTQSGSQNVYVSTASEPDWVESNPFTIAEPQVQNLSIVLDESSIAVNAAWDISFQTSPVGFLPKGDQIHIVFPAGFQLPQSIDSSLITLNGVNVSSQVTGQTLSIITPSIVQGNSNVEIKISRDAQIKNPFNVGDYDFAVYTDSDTFNAPFKLTILPSTVQDVNLQTLYSGIGSVNEFTITFRTGPAYMLSKGADSIKVTFDNGFTLPASISADAVSINNTQCQTVSNDVYSLFATVPLDILASSTVTIKIGESAGIKDPQAIGSYGVTVSTSKEAQGIESNKVSFTPLPVVEFTVNPAQPDGDNGFYRTKPTVQLSTSNGKEVYFKVDNNAYALYSNPVVIAEGDHTLSVYAVDSSGNQGDTINKEFKVDTVPPSIQFDNGIKDLYVNSSTATIKGKVSEPCTLKINEAILDLTNTSDLNFTVQIHVTDGMPVAIYMRDLAGNARSLVLTAYIDSTPPEITLLNPSGNGTGILGYGGVGTTYETTSSNMDIQLKVDKDCTVDINSEPMTYDNGVYSLNVNLNEGDNTLIINAKDLAGNVTTKSIIVKRVDQTVITLLIGSTSASIGSSASILDAPPFIEKDRTFVPLRFISEAFGASIDWNAALQVITISFKGKSIQLQVGSNVALVGTDFVNLDAPPKIVNGRTFVPIRFISETFGAQVNWDATTKTVTIIYKP
jgi:hypothetical protein